MADNNVLVKDMLAEALANLGLEAGLRDVQEYCRDRFRARPGVPSKNYYQKVQKELRAAPQQLSLPAPSPEAAKPGRNGVVQTLRTAKRLLAELGGDKDALVELVREL